MLEYWQINNEQSFSNRMVYEVINFANIYHNNNSEKCHELLEHSLNVVELSVMARKDAEIVFAADKKEFENMKVNFGVSHVEWIK